MNQKTRLAELERLFNADVDGLLSDEEQTALTEALRSDVEARGHYLRFMELHALLHWDHGAEAALVVARAGSVAPATGADPARRFPSWRTLLLAGAAVAAGLLLMGNILLHLANFSAPGEASRAIARAESVQGVVLFRSPAGERLLTAARPESLAAGVLVLEGEASAAQCRFLDGTLITFTGQAEARIEDAGQKRLRLSRGLLTAEVRPQPAGRPLIIETPTAQVEVLGTVFTLAAEAERTHVRVDSGTVRLRRLVDGRAIDVPQEQSCEATLHAGEELRSQPPAAPPWGWEHAFLSPPPAAWKGEWLAPEASEPGRIRAVPCVVGRQGEDQAAPIVHFGISARKTADASLGSLPREGVLRITYRCRQPAALQILIGVHRPGGAFGGNFEAKLARPTDSAAADEWGEVEAPLAEFHPLIPAYTQLNAGDQPFLILITTYGHDAGLEVSEIRITGKEDRRQ